MREGANKEAVTLIERSELKKGVKKISHIIAAISLLKSIVIEELVEIGHTNDRAKELFKTLNNQAE